MNAIHILIIAKLMMNFDLHQKNKHTNCTKNEQYVPYIWDSQKDGLIVFYTKLQDFQSFDHWLTSNDLY